MESAPVVDGRNFISRAPKRPDYFRLTREKGPDGRKTITGKVPVMRGQEPASGAEVAVEPPKIGEAAGMPRPDGFFHNPLTIDMMQIAPHEPPPIAIRFSKEVAGMKNGSTR